MADPDPGLRVLDGEMDEVAVHALASGEVAVFSCRSPGREGPNEDSAAVLPFGDGSYVFAVADGLGGNRAGARASSLAIDALEAALLEARREQWPLRSAMMNGIERATRRSAGSASARARRCRRSSSQTVRSAGITSATR